MNEAESPRTNAVDVIRNLEQARAIVTQFTQDAFDEAEASDEEAVWNTASLANSTLESLEVVMRKPERYDHSKTALFTTSTDGKVNGLGFVAVSHDSVRDTIDFEGEKLSLPHVETIGVVLNSSRGWSAIRLGLETVKFLHSLGVTRFLTRLSDDSRRVMEKYHERGLIKELKPLNDGMKHFLISI